MRTVLWCVLVVAAVVGLGAMAYAAGQCSVDEATESIRRHPNDANGYITRALCYMTVGPGHTKPRLKAMDAAVRDLETALKLDPKNYVVHHNYGHAAYLLGYQDFAVYEFTKAISLNSRSARSYMGRGWAQVYLCDFKNAVPDFQRAVSLDASLRREVASEQSIAAHEAECRRPPIPPPSQFSGPGTDGYFDRNSDYWRNRRWEERPH